MNGAIRIFVGCAANKLLYNPEMDKRTFYVYGLFVDGELRYIGKGTGRRAWAHIKAARAFLRGKPKKHFPRLYRELCAALLRDANIEPSILMSGLSEAAAYAAEREAIAGRDDLWNTLEGGAGANSASMLKLWQSDEFREAVKKTYATPEAKARRSAASRESWQDEKSSARRREALQRSWDGAEERRTKLQQWAKSRMADPDIRAAHSEKLKQVSSTPEARELKRRVVATFKDTRAYREKLSAAIKAGYATPEAKANKAAAMRRAWLDPEARERRIAAIKATKSTPEARQKTSEQVKARRAAQRASRD